MSQIRAVAANVLREVTRKRGFRFFLITLLAIAFFFPRWTSSDDLLGRLQIAVSYGLGFPSILIGIATLVFATGSLSRDIEQRAIHMVATKPVSRWKILLGKLLGVVLLDAGLLLAVLVVLMINVWTFSSEDYQPRHREIANDRFFSPRKGAFPAPRPVSEEAVQSLALQLTKEHEEKSEEETIERVRSMLQCRHVPPQKETVLSFHHLPRSDRPGEKLQLRFKLFFLAHGSELECMTRWTFISRGQSIEKEMRVLNSSMHLIEVDAGIVGDDGELSVVLRNEQPEHDGGAGRDVLHAQHEHEEHDEHDEYHRESEEHGITLIARPESVELLYVVTSFWANLGRALILLLGHFIFIATLGVFGSALFSLPTANLLGFAVCSTGLVSGFLKESLDALEFKAGSEAFAEQVGVTTVICFKFLLLLMPDFSAEDPIGSLVEGRAIPLPGLFSDMGWIVLVRCGVVFFLAAWYWSRRELGGSRT